MSREHRTLCLKCLRAQEVCFCERIRPFESEPLFAILTHPKERRKRIGTGRMAHLCISNSRFFEGVDFTNDDRVNALLAPEAGYFPLLLFPPLGATSESSPAVFTPASLRATVPEGLRPLIFVLDATWGCARTMVRRNPRLARLQRLSFTPARQSGYRFRRQPFAEAFSTIEAIHFVLEAWGASEHANLLEVFEWMVAKQCDYCEPGTRRAVRGVRT